jgi:hypothetical protein
MRGLATPAAIVISMQTVRDFKGKELADGLLMNLDFTGASPPPLFFHFPLIAPTETPPRLPASTFEHRRKRESERDMERERERERERTRMGREREKGNERERTREREQERARESKRETKRERKRERERERDRESEGANPRYSQC